MDITGRRRTSSLKEFSFLGSVGDIDKNVLESIKFKGKKEYIDGTKCNVCEIEFTTLKNPIKHWFAL